MFLFSSLYHSISFLFFAIIVYDHMNNSSELHSQDGLETIQAQLRNALRLCQIQSTKYHDLMEESLGELMDYANTVTQLT